MGSAPPSPGSEGGAYGKGSVHLPRGCREIPPIQNPPPALHSSLPGGAQHQVQPVCTSCAQGQILHTQPGLEGIRQGRRGQGQGKEGSQPPPRGWSRGSSTHLDPPCYRQPWGHCREGETHEQSSRCSRARAAAQHRTLPRDPSPTQPPHQHSPCANCQQGQAASPAQSPPTPRDVPPGHTKADRTGTINEARVERAILMNSSTV